MKRMVIRFAIACCALFCFSQASNASPHKDPLDDVTILVTSCDKYSVLWKPFFTLLYKHFPTLKTSHQHVPILLIANTKSYDDPRVQTIQTGRDVSWTDNMLTALKHVKTKYVLILLEDYIFYQPVDIEALARYVKFMSDTQGAYLQLFGASVGEPYEVDPQSVPGFDNLVYAGKHADWRTSLQACLWDVNVLTWLLKPGESAWDFEVPGSVRSEGVSRPFYRIIHNWPLNYYNAAQLGYLNSTVMDYIQAQGIELEPTTLPLDKDHRFKIWLRHLRSTLYHGYFVPLTSFLKKFLKNLF
jgi:hypothetical protein